MNKFYAASQERIKGHTGADHGMIYKQDGSGRDTYIMFNNGGNMLPKCAHADPSLPLPHLNRYQVQARKSPLPVHAKAVNYRQDGSGRDGYIMYDNGGYRSSGRIEDIKGNFVNGLRSYEVNPDYLKNRNLTSKPDILSFLKKKRLENPFKKHDLHFNSATPSRNSAFIPYSQTHDIHYSPNRDNNSSVDLDGSPERSLSPAPHRIDEDYPMNDITPNMKGIKQKYDLDEEQEWGGVFSKLTATKVEKLGKTMKPPVYYQEKRGAFQTPLPNEFDYQNQTESYAANQTSKLLGDSNNKRDSRNNFILHKIITDNPNYNQMKLLESYQRNLDSKLSQPKKMSPERRNSLTQQASKINLSNSLSQLKQVMQLNHYTSPAINTSDYVSGSDIKQKKTLETVKLRKINGEEREQIFRNYYEGRFSKIQSGQQHLKTTQNFYKKSLNTISDDTRASLRQESGGMFEESSTGARMFLNDY